MEKRLLLAAVLSLAVLGLWELLVPKPRKPPVQAAPAAVSPQPPALAASPAASASIAQAPAPAQEHLPSPVAAREETPATIANELLRATFSNRGAVLTSLLLLRHTDDHKKPLEMVRQLPAPAQKPLAIDFPGNAELTARVAGGLFAVERPSDRALKFSYADDKVAVTKEIRIAGGYLFDVKVNVVGPPYRLIAATGLRNPTPEEQASRYVTPATAIAATPGGFERARPEKMQKPAEWNLAERGFAGLEDNYFLAVLLPKQASGAVAFPVPLTDKEGKPAPTIGAGISGKGEIAARAYYGPKDVEILESLNLGLEKTVDFGWYGILARPLLWLLKRTYGLREQLGSRDSSRYARHPHPALPAHAQELRVDEEDAEARSQDERDPGQIQEGQERRGAAGRR